MAQVSRSPLAKDVGEKVIDIFLDTFAKIKNKDQAAKLLNDLLTPTEKIMLAKRLSIAYMLQKGYDYRTISQVLRVSTTTVARMSLTSKLAGEGFRTIIGMMLVYEKIDVFLSDLVEKVTGAIPPKGRDWSKWRSERLLEEKKRRQPF